jgi:D-arabinose 1-dehydrogenase-like Zn-dependent alcohol dehydrogenase
MKADQAMKALVYTKPDEMTYRDEPDPTMSPAEVLTRVGVLGICSLDMHAYHGRDPRRVPTLRPQ